MRLILVRHGEAEVFTRRIIGGPTGCTGLTPFGRAQAEALARRLESSGELADCSALLCSPLQRARETAQVLSRVLPVTDIVEDCDLCELHPGLADGLTFEEYETRYGAFDVFAEPDRPYAPEGESYNAFVQRIRRVLVRLANTYADRTVVVACHGGIVMGSVVVTFGIPRPGSGARLETANTALTEWRVTDGVWTLVRFNDAAHLRDLG